MIDRCSQIYCPSDAEAERMLANMERYIRALKALNVSSDIAAYIARDYLSPMRLALPPEDKDRTLPSEERICPTSPMYIPAADE